MQQGIRSFWISFFLTLVILAPVVLGLWMYGMASGADKAPVNQHQEGVPIQPQGQSLDKTYLVALAQETPRFVLIRLDGTQSEIKICTIPSQTRVRTPSGVVTLAESYTSAGPARASQLLAETLNIRIDHYLALTDQTMERVWQGLEPMRLNLSGLLEKSEQEQLGLSETPVVSLSAQQAVDLLNQLEQVEPARFHRLRAAVWDAAFRQQQEPLSEYLPAGLQQQMAALLTDVTVTDLYQMQKLLLWLAQNSAVVESQSLPGRYEAEGAEFVVTEESLSQSRSWFVEQVQIEQSPEAPASQSKQDVSQQEDSGEESSQEQAVSGEPHQQEQASDKILGGQDDESKAAQADGGQQGAGEIWKNEETPIPSMAPAAGGLG